MRRSQFFLPTLKETPAEAHIVSHSLMLRAGLVRMASAGIYSWLPLGLRVLRRIEAIVREEQDRAGAQELLMPTIQSADLWERSGRYDNYGKELLRIKDRHGRAMLYGPTNEELITDVFRTCAQSYKDLPAILYQIQWKFRDEIRPRFGVMRGREFLMKDGYSFDRDAAASLVSYHKMFMAYLRTFARLGLRALPLEADTGPIGGRHSHEFVILADSGDTQLYCHADLLALDPLAETAEVEPAQLAAAVERWTHAYARADERHDPAAFDAQVPAPAQTHSRGIEVGHIFSFGQKYSEALGCWLQDRDGRPCAPYMGSYGIGISRLVGAIIEACHDQAGIIWPAAVAPFDCGLIAVGAKPEVRLAADRLYAQLSEAGVAVLYDDRSETAGAKFAEMDLIGLPLQVLVGPRGLANGTAELKHRAKRGAGDAPRREIALDQVCAQCQHDHLTAAF